jgi:hypothetical protein
MTNQSDLLHTWQLPANSKLLAYYRWLYQADVANLSFCKLFWAIVASPAAVVIRAVMFAVHKLPARNPRPVKTTITPPPKKSGPSAALRFSIWLSVVADSIAAAWQPISAFLDEHSGIGKFFRPVALVVGAVAVLGGAAFGFYEWADLNPRGLLSALFALGLLIGGGLLILAAGFGLSALLAGRADAIGEWVDRNGTKIGLGFRAVYRFFAFGYHAVKTRTCPRVEIIPAKVA